ncbi:hypothetical protein FRC01_000346 [Tulasnella sp. 417]|nr:hypothetical protein FRC01_000346 [Tulasnella sp. 417]
MEGNAINRSPRREVENPPSGPLGKARYILAKRRAKKLFLRFTTPSRTNTRVSASRRRKEAADSLLKLVEKEVEGEDLVGRRFTKTALRQENVTRAILALSDEEYQRDVDASKLWPRYVLLTVNDSGPAVRLLDVVIKHSKGSTFFGDSIPRALEDELAGSAAVLFIATTYPRFFELVDSQVIFKYSCGILERKRNFGVCWLRAIRLLDMLMNHLPPTLAKRRDIQLSMARTAIEHVSDFICYRPNQESHVPRRHFLYFTVVLQAGVTSLLQTEGNSTELKNMFESDSVLEGYIGDLRCTIRGISGRSRYPDTHSVERGLALRALALLQDTPDGKLSFADDYDVGAACASMILSQPQMRDQQGFEYNALHMVPYLRVDEDAFDVLCRLPEPIFAKALASQLKASAYNLDPPTENPCDTSPWRSSDVFRLLDTLLWLSNMPPDIGAAHRALVGGDTCAFLVKIVNHPVSQIWEWQEREIWRAKGQAITCLGNIMEKMDGSQIRDHVKKEMIKFVVEIRTNEEAPLAQRDQAKFTLQRYTAVANRWGIEPYWRESAEALDQAPDV